MRSDRRTLQLTGALLLAGWAAYMTVVTCSNVTDLFGSFGWEHWSFRSGNLAYISKATAVYFHDLQANQALLALVIVWEGASSVLLWLAAHRWLREGPLAVGQARRGLVLLLLLWFGFAVSTEVLVAYDRGINESTYWTLAAAVLATLVLLELWARVQPESGSRR